MPRENISALIKDELIVNSPPGQEPFHSVSEKTLVRVAGETAQSPREVMIACLRAGIWPERFRAQRGSFSAEDQARLLSSTAAVIGAGGLGGGVALLLARIGVGHLIICDGDSFEESNLNRQLLSRLDRLGKNKALCAAEEIAAVSPVVQVTVYPVFAREENLPEILDQARVVVDCLDNLAARYLLQQVAGRMNIPFIHGALAGGEGRVLTVFPNDRGLTELYGPRPPSKDESAESIMGTPTVTPTVVAGFQAVEAVNILLGKKNTVRRPGPFPGSGRRRSGIRRVVDSGPGLLIFLLFSGQGIEKRNGRHGVEGLFPRKHPQTVPVHQLAVFIYGPAVFHYYPDFVQIQPHFVENVGYQAFGRHIQHQ